MTDYVKIEQSHRLSEYQVRVPAWTGSSGTRWPFALWATNSPLPWYQVYNTTKHDRHSEFKAATFEAMLDAVCGCLVVLSSQFLDQDFSGQSENLIAEGSSDGFEDAIGGLLRVGFPQSWPASDRYDFDWRALESETDPFDNFPYPP